MRKIISVFFSLAVLFYACEDGSPPKKQSLLYNVTLSLTNPLAGEDLEINVAAAPEGEEITLTARLEPGRRLEITTDDLTLTDPLIEEDGGTIVFTMPAADVLLTVSFSDISGETFPLTTSQNGRLAGESLTADAPRYEAGETVTLTATLGTHRMVELNSPGIDISPPAIATDGGTASFTMPDAPAEVTALFRDVTYPINCHPQNALGKDAVRATPQEATPGSTVTISIDLEENRQVILDGNVTLGSDLIYQDGKTITFTMPSEEVTLGALFSELPEFEVTLNISGALAGEVLTTPSMRVYPGSSVQLNAEMATDRQVTLTSADVIPFPQTISNGNGSSLFTMPYGNVTINADFSAYVPPPEYDIDLQLSGAQPGESLIASLSESPSGGAIVLTAGLMENRRVLLTAEGLYLSSTTLSADGGTATFTMPARDVTITALFEDIPPQVYSLTFHTQGDLSGEGVVPSATTAEEGTLITITADLDTDREVALSAEGVSFTPSLITEDGGTATFTMSDGDLTVTAAFDDRIIPTYQVTLAPTGASSGEVIAIDPPEAREGETVTLTATLNPQRKVTFSSPGLDITPSILITDQETASFIMPEGDVALSATFADDLDVSETEIHLNATRLDYQQGVVSAMDGEGNFVSVWMSKNQASANGKSELYGRLFSHEGLPLTDEFQISAIEASLTYFDRNYYDVDMAADGRFAVAWSTYSGDPDTLYIQRYHNDGTEDGSRITVDDSSDAWTDYSVALSMADTGEIAVVFDWEAGFTTGLKGRTYNSDGTAKGASFWVSDSERAHEPDLAYNGTNLVAVWRENDTNMDIRARLMTEGGTALTDTFDVPAVTSGGEENPSVAMNASGQFVLAWEAEDLPVADNDPIMVQRFDADGSKRGSPLMVSTHDSGNSYLPSVGIDGDGNFAVAWQSYHEPDTVDDNEVWLRTFAIIGETIVVTPPERVNIFYDYHQEKASLDMNEDGDILVSWDDRKQEKSDNIDNDTGVFARLFPME